MKFSLSQVKQALGEVQTLLHWTFNVSHPPQGLSFPENLQIRVTTTSTPTSEIERTQVELGGFTINYTGKVKKSGEITVTLFEGVDAGVTQFIMNWMQLQWGSSSTDTTGKQSATADSKADITMQLMGPDDTVTQTYTLIGCLGAMGEGAELGQEATAHKPTLKLTYDDYRWGAGESVSM